jgi:hypothetical protein
MKFKTTTQRRNQLKGLLNLTSARSEISVEEQMKAAKLEPICEIFH